MRGLIFAILITPASAAPVTVILTDQDQQNWAAISQAFDQCVVGSVNRGDASSCRSISGYLTQFAAQVKAATPTTPASSPDSASTGTTSGK